MSDVADVLRRAAELIERDEETRPFFALYAAAGDDPERYTAAAWALVVIVGPAYADRPPADWCTALRAAAERAG